MYLTPWGTVPLISAVSRACVLLCTPHTGMIVCTMRELRLCVSLPKYIHVHKAPSQVPQALYSTDCHLIMWQIHVVPKSRHFACETKSATKWGWAVKLARPKLTTLVIIDRFFTSKWWKLKYLTVQWRLARRILKYNYKKKLKPLVSTSQIRLGAETGLTHSAPA